ncbi:MAG: hypothetical protein QOF51_2713 [Chloroflexota bacterium]|nr:hypothetical protein [Chloroflexota bacterium]
MARFALVLAVVAAVLVSGAFFAVPPTQAQCSYAPGSPIQLAGTPHLFIVDELGVLHWGGDTRALAGRVINWNNLCAVGLAQLLAAPRGDPWLTAGLPKIGDPIYLAKWEDTEAAPRLLHIQSIADVELFGINTANYGNFILDRTTWQQRYGFDVSTLQVGPLASGASYAWSAADRAAYGQLLRNLENAESATLFVAVAGGSDPTAVLPSIADCERLGLDSFERSRNAGVAFQRAQDCLNRLNTGGVPALQPPGNLRVVAAGPTTLQVSWDPVSTATGYRVYSGDPSAATLTLIANAQPGLTSLLLGGQAPGTTTCYAVTAVNATGESAMSGRVCAAAGSTPTSSALPAAPTNLQVTQVANTAIQLTWSAAPGAQDGFVIYEGNTPIATAPGTTNQWTITGWDPTIPHCYAVAAANAFGQSPRSNTVCAGPGATPVPPTVTPTATGTAAPSASPAPVPPTGTATPTAAIP